MKKNQTHKNTNSEFIHLSDAIISICFYYQIKL